jgi:hypothetical protein
MTPEQKKLVENIALRLKQAIPDFMGSVTFNLSPDFRDVKIEIKETIKAKL